jgi:cytosine/adenosine deaminase-related metal-dependent hydrolase
VPSFVRKTDGPVLASSVIFPGGHFHLHPDHKRARGAKDGIDCWKNPEILTRFVKSYRARLVLPLSAPPIEDGVVVVQSGRIAAVGRARDFSPADAEDLGDVILMPGLINAHCHLDYTVMRGAILQQKNFPNWVQRINELKRTLTDDDYLESIAKGFAELRKWGTTGVFNIESFPELMVRMPAPPLRTWWFYELLDIRNRIHTEDVVAGALTFFEHHPNWLGGFGLSPHAPYTTSAGLYALTKSCCEKYRMPWTTHLAETEEEFEMFVRASGPLHDFLKNLGRPMTDVGGVTPAARLFEGPGVPHRGILAHMNCLTETDYQILSARRDVTVVHCPKCHEYFRRPPFALDRLRESGISVCLGTDSLASNSSLDLFAEMRALRRTHPHISAAELVDMVTRRPARALGLSGKLGEITPGAHADLIGVSFDGAPQDALEAIVQNRQPVSWMLVDGKPLAALTWSV